MICFTSTVSDMPEPNILDRHIAAIARGNTAALEDLYLCTKTAVFGYAFSFLKNSHDAEDVLHDCYLAVYQSASSYRAENKAMAWLFTITKNLCLGKLREKRRSAEMPPEDWECYLCENERISAENRLILSHCLSTLSQEEQEILLLHVLFGLKHREIAVLENKTLSTVLSKYHRALKKMRTLLGEENKSYE